MCGIFGIAFRKDSTLSLTVAQDFIQRLYELSESRGKESAGLHVHSPAAGLSLTLKAALPATKLMRTAEYLEQAVPALRRMFTKRGQAPVCHGIVMAHSRLVTNGTSALAINNQPVTYGDVTVVHNGIIVNVDELWSLHPHLKRNAEVDTEVFAAILDEQMARLDDSPAAVRHGFSQSRGAASVAWVHRAHEAISLATNTGDIYFAYDAKGGVLVYASERYILEKALAVIPESDRVRFAIEPLEAGMAVLWDLASRSSPVHFALQAADGMGRVAQSRVDAPPQSVTLSVGSDAVPAIVTGRVDESLLRYNADSLRQLRRCSRCVLPETFPYIDFDGNGVCNYCRSYRPKYVGMDPVSSRNRFFESIDSYRRKGGQPDVIVPFSGGRDSSFGLHLIKKEFGFNPVTFTYDWGMVTDLARRNIARICGQLGVRNILVSADISQKRDNIRKNVSAWLRKPDLGLVPLFMAGDKHFFRVVNVLKRQTGIRLDLWCANPLENTDFKSGLCGIPPDFEKKRVDHLSLSRKVKLAAYYMRGFMTNPRYFNRSLLDTAGAFLSYYFEPREDFYFIFDHFVWNENEVNETLLTNYDWELSPDSPSTWRIGDGTAPFYNYIYVTANGYSEFDTFRSNQIREGVISRAAALENVLKENQPRTASLRWYLETIGLDFNDVIRTINRLDVLGLHR